MLFRTRCRSFCECMNQTVSEGDSERHLLFLQIVDIVIRSQGCMKVCELEKAAGYSSRYIQKIFNEELGMGVKQFCNTVRLHCAACLMKQGTVRSVGEVAQRFRFYDQSHFIHLFESFYQVTPGQYLAQRQS